MWPTDNPWPAMIVLVCLAMVFFGRFGAKQKSINLVIAFLCLLLAGGCFVLDYLVLTPSEQIVKNLYTLSNAVVRQDVPTTLSFFSGQARERENVRFAIERMKVQDDLRISDVSVSFRGEGSVAVSHFRANASITINIAGFIENVSYHPTRWELDWQREGTAWKIIRVHRLHPLTGKEVGFLSTQ